MKLTKAELEKFEGLESIGVPYKKIQSIIVGDRVKASQSKKKRSTSRPKKEDDPKNEEVGNENK